MPLSTWIETSGGGAACANARSRRLAGAAGSDRGRSQIFNGREQSCVSAVGSRLPWNPAHVAACKVGDIVDSRQRQGPHEFLPEQGQGAVDTGFSAGSKAVKVRPSDRAGSGAKSTSLYDVRPAPDAAAADNVATVP